MINVNELKKNIEDAGLRVIDIKTQPRISNRVFDFSVRADIAGRIFDLLIEVKERPHLVDLRLAAEVIKQYAGPEVIPMLAAHFMGNNRRTMLKQMGVGYLDMVGNMYLRAPSVFMEREGKRNHVSLEHKGLNPYSDKASIVLRVLVNEPKRAWKIREIARAGGINPGWVSRVVQSLVERGLVMFNRENGVTLLRGEDMIKEWADFYDWRQNKFSYYYCHAFNVEKIMEMISKLNLDSGGQTALGFQAGASLVSTFATFHEVHLMIDGRYFDSIRPDIEQQLGLEPRREGANLILVRPYYKYSALFGIRKIKKWFVVSDVQLYLDLKRYPIRGAEQAEHLWDKMIQPGFRNIMRDTNGNK
jgi:DNA-binding transcriptional regulator YhcF (GntR family)